MTVPVWKDRRVERPNTYNIKTNLDGTITLIPVPGTIYEPGTPLNADNLNQINASLAELDAAMDYKIINVSNINTGTVATLPPNLVAITIEMKIANVYTIDKTIYNPQNDLTYSFSHSVDQGGGYDEYIINFTYSNNAISFQKNVRLSHAPSGAITRTDIVNTTDKTEFPRVTEILYR